jgi:16S rRNA (cytidine1402-2'-O)-methyltransferase
VSRELTKIFEETRRGTLKEVCEYFREKTVKGEIVIVVSGRD